jgi:hypothetical protein
MKTGIIEDIITTMIVNETKEFIKHLLIGHNLNDESVDDLTEIIKYRYHASAQRALCLAFDKAVKNTLIGGKNTACLWPSRKCSSIITTNEKEKQYG